MVYNSVMISAVLFDMDDTLLKSQDVKIAALQLTGKKFYHLDISTQTLKKHWGEPAEQFYPAIFAHKDSVDNLVKHYLSVTNRFPNSPYPGAVQTVRELAEYCPVGVLSASARKVVENDLRVSGFSMRDFFLVQSSEDTTVHKPDPAVFDPALHKLAKKGILPKHVLYVGDAVRDFEAATRAGLQFVGIAGHTTSRATFKMHGAKTISKLPEILAIVERTKKAANAAM
jgi:beta-phosphoglucomutase-like phosphatase (HAD superfamily)